MIGHYYDHVHTTGITRVLLAATSSAVDFFFVLSGFVLAMVYGLPSQQGGFARFIGQRLSRVYPLYALVTLACFLLARNGQPLYGEPNQSWLALLANLLMVQFWGWPTDSLAAPGWSISVEWAANLLFPLLAVAMLHWRLPRSVLLLGLLAALSAVSEVIATQEYWDTAMLVQAGWFRLPQPIVAGLVEFMAGMLCWRMRCQTRWPQRLGNPALLAILLAMLLWIGLAALDIYFAALSCLLILGASYQRGAVARALGSPVLHWLGLISFSVYLVHVPMALLVPWMRDALSAAGAPHAFTLANALVMALVLPVATLTYRGIERPAQRWLRQRFSGAQPGRLAAIGTGTS